MQIIWVMLPAALCAACSVSLWAGPYELSLPPPTEAEATAAPDATPTP